MNKNVPNHTAVRVALWRALHIQIDSKPHVLVDEVGSKLVGDEKWRNRPDMNPEFSKAMRASIVGRARFVEDLVKEQVLQHVTQYVILGAGLDTFAQRHPEIASKIQIFEVDQPSMQQWKQKRLREVGYEFPSGLHFISVDFESGESWWEKLRVTAFQIEKPALIVSTGVSMYLSKEANLNLLRQTAKLAPGSTFAMTFLLPPQLLDSTERSALEFVMKKAQEAKTPFLSLFSPDEILEMAHKVGFKTSRYVSAEDLYLRYFANRSDGLRAGNAEAFLVATT